MAIFLNFSPTSSHLHPLQVENCNSNSRLVVDEDDNVNSGLKGLIERITSNSSHRGGGEFSSTDGFSSFEKIQSRQF